MISSIKNVQPALDRSLLSGSKFENSFRSFLVGTFVFLAIFSGRFTTSRIGLADFEVRYILFPVAFLTVAIFNGARVRASVPYGVVLAYFFFMMVIVSGLMNASGELVPSKIADSLFLLASAILVYWAFSDQENSMAWFLRMFAIVGLLYSLYSILSIVGGADRGRLGVGGPNVATRIIFIGALCCIYLSTIYQNKKTLILLPVYAAGIIAIGSRGGMLSAVFIAAVAITILLARSRFGRRGSGFPLKKFLKYALFIVAAAAIFWRFLFPLVADVFQRRFINLVVDRVHYAGRDEIYERAFQAIADNPLLGLGLGGYTEIGISNYPHNIILELMLDGGFLLGVFFIFFVVFSLRYLIICKGPSFFLCLILPYMLLVQQLSGDYYDFRYFFVFLVLLQIILSSRNYSFAK